MALSARLKSFAAAAVAGLACFAIGAPGRDMTLIGFRAQAEAPQPATTISGGGVTLHSVSVELPNSDRMFPGADAEAINNTCLACHSAGMVLNQPALSRSAWQQEVEKMRVQYKAPLDDATAPAIVAYLASHKGAQ